MTEKKWKDARTAAERRALFAEAYAASKGNITETAKRLGISREMCSRLIQQQHAAKGTR